MKIHSTSRPAVLLPLVALLSTSPIFAANSPDVPFKGIATLHKLASHTRQYKAKTAYPTFRSQTPLARFVNAKIGLQQRRGYFDWLHSTKKDLAQQAQEKTLGMLPYEYEGSTALKYFAPNKLISIQTISYQYLGGAHGGSYFQNHNFTMVNGKPKELALSDLFTSGTDYRKFVETQVFAKLKKNPDAAWAQDKSVKTLTPSQFNNFSLTPSGATWTFNEYEMGPFAAGIIEAKLSIAELGPNFKKSLVAR